MSLNDIFTYVYLLFGIIVVSVLLVASYNLLNKGYKTKFSLIVVLGIAILVLINFSLAVGAIRGLDFENLKPQTERRDNSGGNFF
jgi:hypothetical protein